MSTSSREVSEHHIQGPGTVQLLPVGRIKVLNPRSRNKRIYAAIVENISGIGLKRPITVTSNGADENGPLYDLVCGEGRLNAFKALGEALIPCLVVTASESDSHLMSLVENLARRRHSNEELLEAIRSLQGRGYTVAQISRKTGLDNGYVNVMLHLLKHSEQRLIAAVERGWLSISLADKISRAGGPEVQAAMMEAYDKGLLRGAELMKVRRLIDRRSALGKAYRTGAHRPEKKLTPNRLVQTYQTEVRRQRLTIRKAGVTEGRLLFVVTALKRFLADDNFQVLLRAEGIDDIPKQLADRLRTEGRA